MGHHCTTSTGGPELVERLPRAFEIGVAKLTENRMHDESVSRFAFSAPHMHLFSGLAQATRQLPSVTGDTAEFRRVLGRDQMNHAHSWTSKDASVWS